MGRSTNSRAKTRTFRTTSRSQKVERNVCAVRRADIGINGRESTNGFTASRAGPGQVQPKIGKTVITRSRPIVTIHFDKGHISGVLCNRGRRSPPLENTAISVFAQNIEIRKVKPALVVHKNTEQLSNRPTRPWVCDVVNVALNFVAHVESFPGNPCLIIRTSQTHHIRSEQASFRSGVHRSTRNRPPHIRTYQTGLHGSSGKQG